MAGMGIWFVGCESDRESPSQSSVSSERGGGNSLDGSWDQPGIDHNRGMAYIDAWLVANYDTSWTVEGTLERVRQQSLRFVVDSLGYDEGSSAEAIDYASQFDATYENWQAFVDTLRGSSAISELEEYYLRRAAKFLFDRDLTNSEYADSVKAFVDDVVAVAWNENETACLTVTSVMKHSLQCAQVGWEWGPEPQPTFNWGSMGKADAVGGLIGFVGGGGAGAVPGAITASAADATRCLIDYFF